MDKKYIITLIAKGFVRLITSLILIDIFSNSEIVTSLAFVLLISAVDKFLDAINEF